MTTPIEPSLPVECHDFDFLIGRWDASIAAGPAADRRLRGRWSASYLHGGRMVLDDLVVFDADDQPIRSMATLRTWVPEEDRWAMTFLYANEPTRPTALHGTRVGEELHLDAHDRRSADTAAVRFFDITDTTFRWERRDGNGDLAVLIECRRRDA